MENFDLLSTLVSILVKIAISYMLLGLFTLIAVEAISTVLQLRSKFLKKVLKTSLNNDALIQLLYNHSLIKILGSNTNYIDKKVFAHALADILQIENTAIFFKKCNDKTEAFHKTILCRQFTLFLSMQHQWRK